ncbi:MAG: hypothetical protein DLD55_05210 [candidate division SR1 bacterium]|nr:MAG: hypothetical protein DLD55_05210 [candidate division SR1 bacterium]
MKTFSEFVISSFEWDEELLLARFHFHFDEQEYFMEEIAFRPLKNEAEFPLRPYGKDQLFQLLSHLHIALGVSYYKLFPTKTIRVESLALNAAQKAFWNEFYLKGLGEFFYQNQLDPRGLAQFESSPEAPHFEEKIKMKADKSLVLFGGGKDSLVTVELLKKEGQDFDLFSFGKEYPLHQLAQAPTGKKRLILERKLDLQQLKKMLAEGYYNGHLPITGIISFVSLVIAYLYGYKAVITSLEKSADEGNTEYCEMEINHQWSKSSEFEQAFQRYVQDFISEDFRSYSPLRKWYEIRIVQEFCKYPQYFEAFSSCNRNFHQTGSKLTGEQLWCGICPKCAFLYTMLRAFLGKEKTNQIFARDLFADEGLVRLFEELLGISGIKPFECVGTNEEMLLAFWLIFEREGKADSVMMQLFKERILPVMERSAFEALAEKLLAPV